MIREFLRQFKSPFGGEVDGVGPRKHSEGPSGPVEQKCSQLYDLTLGDWGTDSLVSPINFQMI